MKRILQLYGLYGFIGLAFSKLNTVLFFKKSRIIRVPYFIRGLKRVDLGKGLTTGRHLRIDAFSIREEELGVLIEFGRNVQINDYVHIAAIESITFGNNVLIASKVFISDHNHGIYSGEDHSSPLQSPAERELVSAPIVIGNNVWLGEFVSVLPGVSIGDGVIVGSNSVVSKSLPKNTICVGSPARPIKVYNFDSLKWEPIKD